MREELPMAKLSSSDQYRACLGQGWGRALLLLKMVPKPLVRVPRLCSGALSESTAFICWTLKESAGQHSFYPLRLGWIISAAYDVLTPDGGYAESI